MQNLVLVKYSIDTKEDLQLINWTIQELRPYYNLSLLLIQRDNNAMIHNLPIFSSKELYEFHDYGLALDMSGARSMEKMPIQKGWYLETIGQLGTVKFERVKDLAKILENAGVRLDKENKDE